MCATIATMNVKLGMDASDFESSISKAQGAAESFISKASKLGAGMTAGITMPLLGVGAAAIKASTDLNSSMANVASLGVASDRVAELKANVQSMSITTGQSTKDLSEGLYQVVSAFGDTSDTAAILELNARAAAAGLSTVPEAIALTSAVTKGYGDTSANAVKQVSDLAMQTVALGQTTFPELASSIGSVTPLAASLGVAQEELFAVMATGTGVTGGASEVSTQLRGVLQSLMAPTDSMSELMASMGYETGAAMLQGEGLQGTIAAITQASQASGAPLQSYIGSIEGQTLALALAGPQADKFTSNLAAMGQAAGATDAAFKAQTQGINASGFAWQQLQNQVGVLMQKLGDGLGPALAIVLGKLTPVADAAIALADQFSKADAGTQTMIVGALALAAALGPVLMMLPAIGTAIAVLTGPVGLVIGAVALLAAAWATDFGGIQEKTAAVWAAIQPSLQAVADFLQTNIPVALTALSTAWDATWAALGVALTNAQTGWATFQTAITNIQTAITNVLSGAGTWSIALPEWLSSLLSWAWPAVPGIPAWVNTLIEWTWPILGPVAWVAQLVSWIWPGFPSVPEWINALFTWTWPGFPSAPGWLNDLLNFRWPEMPKLPGFATGGAVSAGVPITVGERGSELFVPNVNGTIIPHSELSRWANDGTDTTTTGGGVTIYNTNYVSSPIDVEVLTQRIIDRIEWR